MLGPGIIPNIANSIEPGLNPGSYMDLAMCEVLPRIESDAGHVKD